MKVFHLSHHHGCIADFEYVADRLGLTVTSATFDDGYNIGPDRADRAWERWKDRLLASDVVLISDTAPLSRIVLQHLDEFPGRLLIWVCNRFDYHDAATNDCGFPDEGYYELFRAAVGHPRVEVAAFTPFELHYARSRGVDLGRRVIKPVGRQLPRPLTPLIPSTVAKEEAVFVPPYHNDTVLLDLADICRQGGAPAYSGRYGGPDDLRGFRAIVHIPYSWSTFAFFETLQNAIPVIVPSPRLLLELAGEASFWWPDRGYLDRLLAVSEWYSPEHAFLVRFDDWPHLWWQLAHADLARARSEMAAFAKVHEEATISAWAELIGVREPETSAAAG